MHSNGQLCRYLAVGVGSSDFLKGVGVAGFEEMHVVLSEGIISRGVAVLPNGPI